MATRRFRLASIGGAIAVALLASSAMPAAADGSVDMLLSTDGIEFSSTSARAILDPLVTLVPGGNLGSVLWIRNPTDSRAAVRVSATGIKIPSRGFAEDVTVTTVTSSLGDTYSSTLAELSDCEMLVPSQMLEGGATLRLDLSFAMSPVARNVSQSQRAELSVLIAMRDADAGAFAPSACDDTGVIVGPNPALPDPALPNPALPDPALPNPALPDPALPNPALPDPALPDPAMPEPDATDPAVPSVPASDGSAAGALARTGQHLPVPLIAIGALLLGAGLFLLVGRRRKSEEL